MSAIRHNLLSDSEDIDLPSPRVERGRGVRPFSREEIQPSHRCNAPQYASEVQRPSNETKHMKALNGRNIPHELVTKIHYR